MLGKYTQFQWAYEILWVLASLIISVIACWSIKAYIREDFFWYIFGNMFLGLNYLRWIIFPRHSPVMYSFWFKMIMLLLNIPITLFVVRYFMAAMEVFDSFNFSFGDQAGQLVKFGTPLGVIFYVKQLTVFTISSFLVLILIFEIRALQLIFKWRQVPQSLLK